MTDKQTPREWAFDRACERVGRRKHHVLAMAEDNPERRAISLLADYIYEVEEPPVSRKLLCAREAMAQGCNLPESEGAYRRGSWDHAGALKQCLRAIELFEEGFGA